MKCYSTCKAVTGLAQTTKVHFLKTLSLAIVFVVTAVGSNFAFARDMRPSGVEWRCVQQHDEAFNVLCFPKPTGFGSAALEAPAPIVKASLPGKVEMRPVAERGLEDVFAEDAWSVPLHSPPRDMVMVNQLLQSMLCNTAPNCSVSYRRN